MGEKCKIQYDVWMDKLTHKWYISVGAMVLPGDYPTEREAKEHADKLRLLQESSITKGIDGNFKP